mmetsp:Transcript_5519/g.14201  ORF Transcript_5519/g.14201 Transcript_5519/m.14201 type:complete len:452 (-) Transcript_5519:50-1405(-)
MAEPRALSCGVPAMNVAMHPSRALAATALVNGDTQFWNYESHEGRGAERRCAVLEAPSGLPSCRLARFDAEGANLLIGYSSGLLRLVDTETVVASWSAEAPETDRVKAGWFSGTWVSEKVYAGGLENGLVAVYDVRASTKPVLASLREQQDYISDIIYNEDKTTLVSTSGDGTLGVYKLKSGLRRMVKEEVSDEQDDDMLCLQSVRDGKKIIVGGMSGVLNLWSWGRWLDISDRYPGHPRGVQCMLKWDESTILTGSGDGLIRVCSVLPNRLLGVLVERNDSVESMVWSHDRRLIASTWHDSKVRFHDISILHGESDDEEDEGEEQGVADDNEKGDGEEEEEEQDGGRSSKAPKASGDSDQKRKKQWKTGADEAGAGQSGSDGSDSDSDGDDAADDTVDGAKDDGSDDGDDSDDNDDSDDSDKGGLEATLARRSEKLNLKRRKVEDFYSDL